MAACVGYRPGTTITTAARGPGVDGHKQRCHADSKRESKYFAQQWYAELFNEVQSSNNLFNVDEDSPHTLGTAGNELWATGTWSQTLIGQNRSTEVKGYWSAVGIREGDDWNIRMLCFNVASAPAATASPTASPTSQ